MNQDGHQRCQEKALSPLDGRGQGKCLDGKTGDTKEKSPFFKRLSILLKTCIFLVVTFFCVSFFFFAFRSTAVVYVHDVLMC